MIKLPKPTALPDGNRQFFSSDDRTAEVLAIDPRNLHSWPPPPRPLVCFRLRTAPATRARHFTSKIIRFDVRPDELLAVLQAICAVDSQFHLNLAAV